LLKVIVADRTVCTTDNPSERRRISGSTLPVERIAADFARRIDFRCRIGHFLRPPPPAESDA